MKTPKEDQVFIDTVRATLRDLIDGLQAGQAKTLFEKDGTPRAVMLDAATYEQLVQPKTDLLSPFSLDDVIQALESELNDLRNLNPQERGQLLMLADAQRGLKDALAGRVTSAAEFRQNLLVRAKRRDQARSKDRESSE